MMFYISGTGERTAESYDGSSAGAPKLVVTYSTGSPDNGGGETPECEDINVTITFDKYSYETSWTLKDNNGQTVMSGGNYTQGNGESITVSECIPVGCYEFTINDDYGDGICCSYGSGSYEITNSKGDVLASGGSFGSSETKQVCLDTSTAAKTQLRSQKIEETNSSEMSIYPNPAVDRIYIKGGKNTILWTAKIVDVSGRKVIEVPVINNSIDVSAVSSNSIYIVEIYDELGQRKLSEKIMKK